MKNPISKDRLQELGINLLKHDEFEIRSRELRIYQDDIKNTIATQIESLNDLQRFVAYFLDMFIDDFFYNLAGDFPYREDLEEPFKEVINEILTQVGDSVRKIASGIEVENYDECCRACSDITSIYLEKIAYLDQRLMEDISK